uniref:Claudin-4 n=1 Tax=Knipowitschia caucasica TaxID=637954 RepID=A0AAV2J880_KNICA
MWRVTAFIGSTIITSQTIWEGIWMTCIVESTGHIQCKPYDSMLALTSDLMASRALMVLAVVTGAAGLVLAFVGGKCTRFLDNEGPEAKRKVAIAAGAVLVATGVFTFIPALWAAGEVVRQFYSVAIDAQKRELGACLYIGWGSAILLILGGGLFITSACKPQAHDTDKNPSLRYLVVRSSNGSHPRLPSVQSHPVGAMSRSQSYEQPTNRSNFSHTRPAMADETRLESDRSWTPSSKIEMKRPGSAKSEFSEASTTKSQLKRAELDEVEDLAQTNNEDALMNPAKTYL